MLRPKLNVTRTDATRQVLEAFMNAVQPYVPLTLQGTRLRPEDLWAILGYASVHRMTIEGACNQLESAPSGNRLREVLHAALPERAVLQEALNTALRQQLPRPFRRFKRSFALALDLTLIPYHGDRTLGQAELRKAQAKAGTHYFHGYATVSIVHHWRRYVLALRFVSPGESMVEIVQDLLERVRRVGVPIRRVYLDKEFYAYEVFALLKARHLAYVIPVPARDAVKRLFHGHTRFDTYTLQSPEHGPYPLRVALVHRPILRLVLVGLALLLLNVYVTLRRGHTWVRRHWLTLLQLMRALARAVEAQFGIQPLQDRYLPLS